MKNILKIWFKYCFIVILIFFILSCEKEEKFYVHKFHGVWNIDQYERLYYDTLEQKFISFYMEQAAGYIYFYDHMSDEYNDCYYGGFSQNEISYAFNYLEYNTSAGNYKSCYWFADNENRLTIWHPGIGANYYSIFFVEKIEANKYNFIYYHENTDLKEILHVSKYK